MYNIYFYKDRHGKEPLLDYLRDLASTDSKDSRIKLNKINDYIKILQAEGTRAGEPFVKHIEGDIWELRPLKDRIFFISWLNNSFILLHHFRKKSQRTPLSEIKKARRELKDIIERGLES